MTAGVLATVPPPDLASAAAFLRQQLGVPVALTFEEPFGLAGRQNDSPPWYAGGRAQTPLQDDKYKFCSTGWGIRTGEGDNQKDFVLTAAHCSDKGKKVHNGDRSRVIGTVTDIHKELDSAIVPVVSASINMFTGRPTSGTFVPMEKEIEVKVGAWVCDSGASTGQNCDIKVDGVNERIEADIGWVRVTTTVHKEAEGIAGGKGDSGGPVYIPVDKHAKVQAVGIVVATKVEVPCRRDDDTQECNKRMAFAPVGALLKHWKATLIASG